MGKTMRTLGIILAGGTSSRLYPSTLVTTKQLLPIYDKPLIYYSLSTLMLAGIRDFIIITTPAEKWSIVSLFNNAQKELGIDVTVLVQHDPTGIADAFNIVKTYLGELVFDYDNHALILGDNIFYSGGLTGLLKSVIPSHANIFLYPVQNPSDFGIAELDGGLKVVSLEEKPTYPKSNLAVTGLYFYPPSVYLYARQLVPSKRGELEITDLNNLYLKNKELLAVTLPRGTVWFDTGNPDAMLEAANFVQTIQKHQSYLIGSPHEIAINSKWVTNEDIQLFIDVCKKTHYGQYLQQMLRS
jgi:glucose-1-phosphate thymidylyltransferase